MESLKRKINRSLYILRYDGPGALFAAIRKKLSRDGGPTQEEMLSLPTAQDRFSKIYEDNLWGGVESLSGPGSSLEGTAKLRACLPALVKEYGIRSIVDAPCGDFAWMKLVLPDLNVRYTGCDIVGSVIAKNKKLFAGPGIDFDVKDITADPLPQADLVFVRDCLFHLSLHDIDRFLRLLAEMDYKYLMTTTHLVGGYPDFQNGDITTGDFRLIDLFAPPFGFRRDSILTEVEDYPESEHPRVMVLIAKEDVPVALMPTAQATSQSA